MINKKIIIALFCALSISCASDSNSNTSANKSGGVASPTSRGGESAIADVTQSSKSQLSEKQPENKPVEPINRKIIRNADLTLEANSPEEVQQKITAITESKNGFVIESQQRSNSSDTKTRDTVTMKIRVPAEKFTETLEEIRKSANRVIIETVKGQDVTEEFLDVEARLKAKKALEEQFLEIMKQGKTVDDALKIQRELANVRGEIEQIEGRKRFLENQAALSTIDLLIQTPNSLTPNSTGFFYELSDSISDGFGAALGFILIFLRVVIALIPFLILVVLPIYLVIRYLVKRNNKQKTMREIVLEETKNE